MHTTRREGRAAARGVYAPDGAFVWTRDDDGHLWLGRLNGPWRYDDSMQASVAGIHHVRATDWAARPVASLDVPADVRATFARGGRNFQRTHSAAAEAQTAALWQQLMPLRADHCAVDVDRCAGHVARFWGGEEYVGGGEFGGLSGSTVVVLRGSELGQLVGVLAGADL